MKKFYQLIAISIFFAFTQSAVAESEWLEDTSALYTLWKDFSKPDAAQPRFFGLASYYNEAQIFIVGDNGVSRISKTDIFTIEGDQWVAITGRYKALALSLGTVYSLGDKIQLSELENLASRKYGWQLYDKSELEDKSANLAKLRRPQLWTPLGKLTNFVEDSLLALHKLVALNNWGVTIILFGLLVKLLLIPLAILTNRLQAHVSRVSVELAPELRRIKEKYDGEEAHNRIMAEHKKIGVSPFYTLKPLLAPLIQIPLLIAIFNALGEMQNLDGASFLWIDNLAYYDGVWALPFSIPGFGDTLNLLPCLMTFVSISSTMMFSNSIISADAERKQRQNLYLMSIAFLLLFYPFPAAMVLYWTTSNFLHLFQQRLIRL